MPYNVEIGYRHTAIFLNYADIFRFTYTCSSYILNKETEQFLEEKYKFKKIHFYDQLVGEKSFLFKNIQLLFSNLECSNMDQIVIFTFFSAKKRTLKR